MPETLKPENRSKSFVNSVKDRDLRATQTNGSVDFDCFDNRNNAICKKDPTGRSKDP